MKFLVVEGEKIQINVSVEIVILTFLRNKRERFDLQQ